MSSEYLVDLPKEVRANLLLAHGAGAGRDSEFLTALAAELCSQGIAVYRFEFPYMKKILETGKKRPPDRAPVLLDSFLREIGSLTDTSIPLFIGGKSMGGRMASLLVSAESDAILAKVRKDRQEKLSGVAGAVCFGYPFHPPGKSETMKTMHFPSLERPLCIIQGTRDPFGKEEELGGISELYKDVRLNFLPGGNHDFKPPVKSGASQAELISQSAKMTKRWMEQVLASGG